MATTPTLDSIASNKTVTAVPLTAITTSGTKRNIPNINVDFFVLAGTKLEFIKYHTPLILYYFLLPPPLEPPAPSLYACAALKSSESS